MNKKVIGSILLVLVLLITAFIFYNSSQNSTESHEDSNAIVEFIEPIVEPIIDTFVTDNSVNLDYYVRKSAHIIEFSALGISLMCFYEFLKNQYNKNIFFIILFYALSVAVTDEFIQSFTGRTSSVKDIILDFFGVAIGIVVFVLFVKMLNLINKRRTKEKKQI